jgi:hypothetical protein
MKRMMLLVLVVICANAIQQPAYKFSNGDGNHITITCLGLGAISTKQIDKATLAITCQ